MQKIYKSLATFGLVALLIPTFAFAKDNHNKESHKHKEIEKHISLKSGHNRAKNGTITAIGSTSFILQPNGSTTPFTVNITGATITQVFGLQIQIGDIHVNDKAVVKGTVSGNTINATSIIITPANTHRAEAKGVVTAVNGNTITLQTKHRGVVNSVTINTNSSTTVQNQNNATSSISSIVVGSKIQVKGLWNELLNVLNAFKIKIK